MKAERGDRMKARIIIDPERDEEVLIYVKAPSPSADAVLDYASGIDTELVGRIGDRQELVDLGDVECFISESGSVYAVRCDGARLELRKRLYEIEELYGDALIKLNQSCLANLEYIRCFDTSLSGSVIVEFKSGYRDYVSRRQMKEVKERILSK